MVYNRRQKIKIEKLKKGDWIALQLKDNEKIMIGKIEKILKQNLFKNKYNYSLALCINSKERKWVFAEHYSFKKLKVNKKFSFKEARSLEKLWPIKKEL